MQRCSSRGRVYIDPWFKPLIQARGQSCALQSETWVKVSSSFAWLVVSNAGLSPRRLLRGPKSQEVGEEGECT